MKHPQKAGRQPSMPQVPLDPLDGLKSAFDALHKLDDDFTVIRAYITTVDAALHKLIEGNSAHKSLAALRETHQAIEQVYFMFGCEIPKLSRRLERSIALAHANLREASGGKVVKL